MPQALYQKYRPQSWADLTDQNAIRVTLTNEITRSELAHAYLFVGPRGVGKTTTARLLAKSVNCLNRPVDDAEPCNSCASCLAVQLGQSLDVIEIDAASHTGVDHIREVVLEGAEVKAGTSPYRVYIIDEVHMLSASAFNAMLKLLEEPPAHAIFILATTEVHKVPLTIVSRCQRFDFRRVSTEAIVARLRTIVSREGVEVDDEILTSIAIRAEGSLRDAESVLGQVLAVGGKKISAEVAALVVPPANASLVIELIDYCLDNKPSEALAAIDRAVTEGLSIHVFMDECLQWLRLAALYNATKRLDVLTQYGGAGHQEAMLRQAAKAELSTWRNFIEIFLKWRRQVGESPIYQLPLEMAILEASSLSDRSGSGRADSAAPASQASRVVPLKVTSPKISKPVLETDVTETVASVATMRSPGTVTLSVESVTEKWEAFLTAVKEANHSLAFLLTNVQPGPVREGILELSVPYAFHGERLADPKIQNLLTKVCEKVFEAPLLVRGVVNG
jgi:DNA polymerase III subunit gamma/tau